MLAGRPGVTPGQFKAPRHPRSLTASASRSPPRGSAHTPAHKAAAPLYVPALPLSSTSSGLSGQGQNMPGTRCTLGEHLCLGTRQRPAGPLLLESPPGAGRLGLLRPGAGSERREGARPRQSGDQPPSSPRPAVPITDLTHRGEADQRHAGVARLHDIEALAFG